MTEESCGWNRSKHLKASADNRSGSGQVPKIVAVVAVVCAFLAGIVCFLMSSREDGSADQASVRPKNIANKNYKKLDEISSVKVRKQYKDKPKSVDEAMARIEEAQEPLKLEPMPKVESGNRPKKVFATATEQVLSWLCHTELGEPPMPPPPLPDGDMANLAQILITKNEIKDDDPPEVANAKQMVNAAKKEMMKFIREGGNPDEFMQYVFREQKKAFETRSMAREMCDELADEDPKLAKEFAVKANAKLADQGILPIGVPEVQDDGSENAVMPESQGDGGEKAAVSKTKGDGGEKAAESKDQGDGGEKAAMPEVQGEEGERPAESDESKSASEIE